MLIKNIILIDYHRNIGKNINMLISKFQKKQKSIMNLFFCLDRFVSLVRSRMPKIILYRPDAKCSLMETGVDFEVIFLCGVKITIFRENVKSNDPLKIKILNNNDKSESLLDYDRITAPNISAIEHFSPEIRQMIDNAILVNYFFSFLFNFYVYVFFSL
jgi:hypothetical protein